MFGVNHNLNDINLNKKISVLPTDQLSGPIYFGWSVSPFGQCFILLQSDILVGLAFKYNRTDRQIETEMKNQLSANTTKFKSLNTDKKAENIFSKNIPVNISFDGNQLQFKVWKALLEIPLGETVTYSHIADKTKNSQAVRAVATAIGQNPIAWLIPCHRVIRKSGSLGGYRWGLEIKKNMLSNETKM